MIAILSGLPARSKTSPQVLESFFAESRRVPISTMLIGTHGEQIHASLVALLRQHGYVVTFECARPSNQPDGIVLAELKRHLFGPLAARLSPKQEERLLQKLQESWDQASALEQARSIDLRRAAERAGLTG